MRGFHHLLKRPSAYKDPSNLKKGSYDLSGLINKATVFDVSSIADQLIEKISIEVITPAEIELITTYTKTGEEFMRWREGGRLAPEHYVGIVPPFNLCWFEFPIDNFYGGDVPGVPSDYGVLLVLSEINHEIRERYPAIQYLVKSYVFEHFCWNGVCVTTPTTSFNIPIDGDGVMLSYEAYTLGDADFNMMAMMISLYSIMMMNHGFLRNTLSPEKSRQQRRYEERHPDRAEPFVRYHILSLNPETTRSTDGDGSNRKGGWEVAWHRVRGHDRYYKSGKVIRIKPHTKGNPLKGIVLKDYKVKGA
jgi:hypothetical protein